MSDDPITGGGKRLATLKPIYGRDKVVRFFAGVMGKGVVPTPDNIRLATVNGMPGLLMRLVDEGTIEAAALQIEGDRIVAIYAMRNPDKLAHLSWPDAR